jgi:hypothetical protein
MTGTITAEHIRTSLRIVLDSPCDCGDCPPDGVLWQMIRMSDEDLLKAYEAMVHDG